MESYRLYRQVKCQNASDLVQLGEQLAGLLADGDVCLLNGDLGVGKTTFVQGVAKGLGVEDYVTSPTFNLMSIYDGRKQLIHIDAYRVELGDILNIEEFAQPPFIVMVEWPDNLSEIQGLDVWKIDLKILEDGTREVCIFRKN